MGRRCPTCGRNDADVPLARVLRLLTIHGLLRADRCPSASALGRKLRVSRRTVFRDLTFLRSIGAPIEASPGLHNSRYRYTDTGFELLPALANLR